MTFSYCTNILNEFISLITLVHQVFTNSLFLKHVSSSCALLLLKGLFQKMASPSNTYYVTVVEDTAINRVISTATLVTELQFNHRCPMVRVQTTNKNSSIRKLDTPLIKNNVPLQIHLIHFLRMEYCSFLIKREHLISA